LVLLGSCDRPGSSDYLLASPEASLLIEVNDLSKSFGGLRALDQVDLGVEEGEVLGLIGPNGAGKTTLFNCLSGVLKPTSGDIRFRGERIIGRQPHQLVRKGICHTHQIPRPFGEMSVRENVLVGAFFGRRRRDNPIQRAEQALAFVQLGASAAAPASTLTVGQRKLLEIARALATDPEVLLLDEVCGGLNPTETSHVLELIRRLPERGTTVVYIEHNMRAVMTVCDRIAVLDFGRKIADGAPREIARNEGVIQAYLGVAPADSAS
jgi:branched-chain amino acid transport system ATP-binding protein